MKKLVSRSEFARMAGVTPGGVTKACKKMLAPAIYGKRIDANHTAAIEYLKKRTCNMTTASGWIVRNESNKQTELKSLINESYAEMTLMQVLKKHGTDVAFSDWLRAVKLIEDINEKRLKNARTVSGLVNRQLVKECLIEKFEVFHKRLITDGAKMIASSAITMNGAGYHIVECERFIANQISSHIMQMKSEVIMMIESDLMLSNGSDYLVIKLYSLLLIGTKNHLVSQ